MKQFQTFITEARVTKASSQAKRLGLVGDGHGDWYDRQGNLKAKTVGGELKMFTGREKSDDELQDTENGTALVPTQRTGAADIVKAMGHTPLSTMPPVGNGNRETGSGSSPALNGAGRTSPVTIAFDKFDNEGVTSNIISAVQEVAEGDYFYIFPSRNEGDNEHIKELQAAYPKISESIVDHKNAETVYDVLQSMYENGFDAINIVCRKSRAKAISDLAYEQNGNLYNFVMMNVIPVDERTIREQYISGDLFKMNSMVESHGREGKVIRRGANHLICVDEDKEMFRCWISEAVEKQHFILPIEF